MPTFRPQLLQSLRAALTASGPEARRTAEMPELGRYCRTSTCRQVKGIPEHVCVVCGCALSLPFSISVALVSCLLVAELHNACGAAVCFYISGHRGVGGARVSRRMPEAGNNICEHRGFPNFGGPPKSEKRPVNSDVGIFRKLRKSPSVVRSGLVEDFPKVPSAQVFRSPGIVRVFEQGTFFGTQSIWAEKIFGTHKLYAHARDIPNMLEASLRGVQRSQNNAMSYETLRRYGGCVPLRLPGNGRRRCMTLRFLSVLAEVFARRACWRCPGCIASGDMRSLLYCLLLDAAVTLSRAVWHYVLARAVMHIKHRWGGLPAAMHRICYFPSSAAC